MVVSSGGDDSFWVRIPESVPNTTDHPSGWIRYNWIDLGNSWHWDEVHSDEFNTTANPVVEFTLRAGTHTLEIARREDGTQLDAIAVLKN